MLYLPIDEEQREDEKKKKKHIGVYTAAMKGSKKDVETFMAQIRA